MSPSADPAAPQRPASGSGPSNCLQRPPTPPVQNLTPISAAPQPRRSDRHLGPLRQRRGRRMSRLDCATAPPETACGFRMSFRARIPGQRPHLPLNRIATPWPSAQNPRRLGHHLAPRRYRRGLRTLLVPHASTSPEIDFGVRVSFRAQLPDQWTRRPLNPHATPLSASSQPRRSAHHLAPLRLEQSRRLIRPAGTSNAPETACGFRMSFRARKLGQRPQRPLDQKPISVSGFTAGAAPNSTPRQRRRRATPFPRRPSTEARP